LETKARSWRKAVRSKRRAAFEKLSDKARQLVTGQSGYYVVNCPMLKKDWVQTSEKIANPYGGKEMATCGEIKK
jgi:hypothetical protein